MKDDNRGIKDAAVVYEDNHLIVISKPFGMPSQGDNTGDYSAVDWVTDYLREKYQKPGNIYVGLLHRLDRPAGGLLLMAKTSKAAARMSEMFQKRKIDKRYLVVTTAVPKPASADLQHYLAPVASKTNIMRAYDQAGQDRKLAKLNYEVLKQQNGQALVQIVLETGRKHQIRVQMAKIGCGILGDMKYCPTEFLSDKSIALFAWKIRFLHPVRKEDWIEIEAPFPTTSIWNDWKLD